MEAFVLGFVVNVLTGFDDLVTRLPILSGTTKTFTGKIIFAIGSLIATLAVVSIAVFFGQLLHSLPFGRTLTAITLFVFAVALATDALETKRAKRAERHLAHLTVQRATQLFGIGFLATALTKVDDALAFVPLFLDSYNKSLVVAGIVAASILELILIVQAAHWLRHFKHRNEIAAFSLAALGVLVLFGIV